MTRHMKQLLLLVYRGILFRPAPTCKQIHTTGRLVPGTYESLSTAVD